MAEDVVVLDYHCGADAAVGPEVYVGAGRWGVVRLAGAGTVKSEVAWRWGDGEKDDNGGDACFVIVVMLHWECSKA